MCVCEGQTVDCVSSTDWYQQQQGDRDTRDLLQLGAKTQKVDFKVYHSVYTEHTHGPTHSCVHDASDLNVDLVGLTEFAGATPLFGSFICLLRAPHCA